MDMKKAEEATARLIEIGRAWGGDRGEVLV